MEKIWGIGTGGPPFLQITYRTDVLSRFSQLPGSKGSKKRLAGRKWLEWVVPVLFRVQKTGVFRARLPVCSPGQPGEERSGGEALGGSIHPSWQRGEQTPLARTHARTHGNLCTT